MLPSLTETQRLAEAARQGLRMVAEGEDKTMLGWVIYGRALNEGRKLFPSNERFGRWVVSSNLEGTHPADTSAAMWASADEAAFEETPKLHPRVRIVRGLHAKWKETQHLTAEPKPTFEEPTEAERETVRKLRATKSNQINWLVDNLPSHRQPSDTKNHSHTPGQRAGLGGTSILTQTKKLRL
jgi:hypothetical protein